MFAGQHLLNECNLAIFYTKQFTKPPIHLPNCPSRTIGEEEIISFKLKNVYAITIRTDIWSSGVCLMPFHSLMAH